MNKKLFILFIVTVLLSPVFSFAIERSAFDEPTLRFTNFVDIIIKVLDFIWLIFAAISIIMFIVAGIDFFTAQGEPGKLEQARRFVIWGLVGVAVAIIGFGAVATVSNILVP